MQYFKFLHWILQIFLLLSTTIPVSEVDNSSFHSDVASRKYFPALLIKLWVLLLGILFVSGGGGFCLFVLFLYKTILYKTIALASFTGKINGKVTRNLSVWKTCRQNVWLGVYRKLVTNLKSDKPGTNLKLSKVSSSQ